MEAEEKQTSPVEDIVGEEVTRDQFYKILGRASQPIKEPKSGSKESWV